jgi:hypothetical protein
MEAVAVHVSVPLRSGAEGHVSFWAKDDTATELLFAVGDRTVVFDLTAQATDALLLALEDARARQKRASFVRYLRAELADKRAHSSLPVKDHEPDTDPESSNGTS